MHAHAIVEDSVQPLQCNYQISLRYVSTIDSICTSCPFSGLCTVNVESSGTLMFTSISPIHVTCSSSNYSSHTSVKIHMQHTHTHTHTHTCTHTHTHAHTHTHHTHTSHHTTPPHHSICKCGCIHVCGWVQ